MINLIVQLTEGIPHTEVARDIGVWSGAMTAGAALAGTLLAMGRKVITAPIVQRLDSLTVEQQAHAERQEEFEDRTDLRLDKISGTQDQIGQRVSKIEGHLGL
ncbi:MAG: hypothetical protein WAS05_00840 [Candidatus Nanopelagicales bacterium]